MLIRVITAFTPEIAVTPNGLCRHQGETTHTGNCDIIDAHGYMQVFTSHHRHPERVKCSRQTTKEFASYNRKKRKSSKVHQMAENSRIHRIYMYIDIYIYIYICMHTNILQSKINKYITCKWKLT